MKRLKTSRERKAQVAVNLYRRLKERENYWHSRHSLLNDATTTAYKLKRLNKLMERNTAASWRELSRTLRTLADQILTK